MPVSDLHHQVTSIAFGAAAEHRFALSGGNALIAHKIISELTQDVVMQSVKLSTRGLSPSSVVEWSRRRGHSPLAPH
jgi:hypothetical protein